MECGDSFTPMARMADDERRADDRHLAERIRGEIEDALAAALTRGPFAQRWGPGVQAVAEGFGRTYLESLATAVETGEAARFVREANQAMVNAAGREIPGSEIIYVVDLQLRRHLGPTDVARIEPLIAAVEADI